MKPSLSLREEVPDDDLNQRTHEDFLLAGHDLLWYTPMGRVPVLPVH